MASLAASSRALRKQGRLRLRQRFHQGGETGTTHTGRLPRNHSSFVTRLCMGTPEAPVRPYQGCSDVR
eukprot:6204396-Pleurochrysis_carterae.AAC.3